MKRLMTAVSSLLFVAGISYPAVAGNMNSPGDPSAGSGMYTLLEVYNYLNAGTVAPTPGPFKGPLAGPTPDSVTGTMKTTKQIYEAVATPFPRCDATAANVASGKKFFSTVSGSWGVQTGTLSSYGLPKTGLEKCYDERGTEISCAASGQDAHYADPAGDDIGYPRGKVKWENYDADGGRFKDNGDGTITDNATGLEWIKDPIASPGGVFASGMSWSRAITNCEALDYPAGSHKYWRLPNIKELMSIVDYGTYDPAIDTTFFRNAKSEYYWSSTTDAGHATGAWSVNFGLGNVNYDDKGIDFYVRAVRGGE